MGRKIPGKKHRGIKDPAKQRAQRWNELKGKVNTPPENIEDQQIPKSLERVMQLKADVKSGKIGSIKKRKNKKSKKSLITLGAQSTLKLHPKAKPDKAVPVFDQKPDESTYAFWNRVNRETHQFLNETTFEKKYGVEIKRNAETGDIEGVEKQQKDEIDELTKLKMKHKNVGKKKKKKVSLEPKLSKSQKRKRRLEMKQEKKLQENIDEFKDLKDEVKFGEIAHAPPELRIKPKRADQLIIKPANKELLLSSMLGKGSTNANGAKPITVDRKGKRKNLPAAERRIVEKQQSEIVAAYKLLKARKLLNTE